MELSRELARFFSLLYNIAREDCPMFFGHFRLNFNPWLNGENIDDMEHGDDGGDFVSRVLGPMIDVGEDLQI